MQRKSRHPMRVFNALRSAADDSLPLTEYLRQLNHEADLTRQGEYDDIDRDHYLDGGGDA